MMCFQLEHCWCKFGEFGLWIFQTFCIGIVGCCETIILNGTSMSQHCGRLLSISKSVRFVCYSPAICDFHNSCSTLFRGYFVTYCICETCRGIPLVVYFCHLVCVFFYHSCAPKSLSTALMAKGRWPRGVSQCKTEYCIFNVFILVSLLV
jgi:hypothetical protein